MAEHLVYTEEAQVRSLLGPLGNRPQWASRNSKNFSVDHKRKKRKNEKSSAVIVWNAGIYGNISHNFSCCNGRREFAAKIVKADVSFNQFLLI